MVGALFLIGAWGLAVLSHQWNARDRPGDVAPGLKPRDHASKRARRQARSGRGEPTSDTGCAMPELNYLNLADPNMNVMSRGFGRINTAQSAELGGSRTGQVSKTPLPLPWGRGILHWACSRSRRASL